MAQTALLIGYETLPDDRTATDGFVTFSVAPNGYTNVRDLQRKFTTTINISILQNSYLQLLVLLTHSITS